MINIITYEQPLNERMRTFLRIKQLMQNFEHR
jgi:cell division FtsZ-interacting protein ZapD